MRPLKTRVAYSKKRNAKFRDDMAVDILSRMDYNFSLAEKDLMMSKGVIARTILLERVIGNFIRRNPKGTVINIGCGLATRVYRLKTPPSVRWYNLDLPETIEVRRQFVAEDGHISMIAKSVMDESWAEEIEEPEDRMLIFLEGLVMYLSEKDVKKYSPLSAAGSGWQRSSWKP